MVRVRVGVRDSVTHAPARSRWWSHLVWSGALLTYTLTLCVLTLTLTLTLVGGHLLDPVGGVRVETGGAPATGGRVGGVRRQGDLGRVRVRVRVTVRVGLG